MQDSTLVIGFIAVVLAVYVVDRLIQAKKNANLLPLPPGPKGLPLLGNLLDLPKTGTFEAKHWANLAELHGPINSVSVMGKTLILINDSQLALDMLEKRSTFASRPQFHFAGDIIGWGRITAAMRYNNTLRDHRKSFARVIGTKSLAAQYHEMQEAENAHFLLHLLDNPDILRDHIKRQGNVSNLNLLPGQEKRDPLIDMIQRSIDDLSLAAVPGAFLVDILPILRYVPDWVPGTGWKKTARRWAYELNAAIETPYEFTKHQLSEGRDNPSYIANLIRTSENTPEQIHSHQWSSAALYSGGTDTTVSTTACFFLAMTMYSDVQAKAQAEIDRVVGTGRLPSLEDREALPYVEAVLKETLRWHTVIPMGLPHAGEEDTTYEGYRIPKEAMIMPNIWRFTHDPETYHDPEEFRPERHLESENHQPETDPRKFVFGFGRRICPGRIFADNALFLTFSQSLAVFNIRKKSVDGNIVEPKMKSMPGSISHLGHYETSIEPRSAHHEDMIHSLEKRYPWPKSDGETLKRMVPPQVKNVSI
ncbi:cytochrome p450 oxidoreductase [Colletotrichum karsti]|uniref:Cytochrome p450 oxidoreductase n=1 Tax=Colletotrichum karsti TaxID=1095194 RepID=A0A9P6IFH6_9PEZI|nr:cytochrome p450 oxidoreductase [Colletotrichum karsti]KAF9881452.1 cytochrome p450 oxidoreductase [Colletotrichum karsti]